MRSLLISAALLDVTVTTARDDDVVSYGLVVGSNRPGPGQTSLAFAEDDAREVADVLRDLGGYDRSHVQLVLHPTPTALLAAITTLDRAITADAAAGKTARVFFYYSGHAKASGLSLGADELALDTLRARLFATKASLTVVVLDACQSGAFSRVKGAEPAADFSYNSKARLNATGVAVLASSTGSELSQESDFLRSSYFTHHFLIGLRGAADDNHDGQVSLDEAYRYTYHQTLVTTAATAVGSQHVSVEVDLKGAGEIPLSYPEKTTATLTLPADSVGQVLIVRTPARAVIAELQKAKGAVVQVPVAPGSYQVLFRTDAQILRCPIVANGGGPSTVALDTCTAEATVVNATKGGAAPAIGPLWLVTAAAGVGGFRDDDYTRRLSDFGYHAQTGFGARLGVDGLRRVRRNVLVGGQASLVGGERWTRTTDLDPLTIEWNTMTLGGVGRVEIGSWAIAYAQLGAGLALTGERFQDQAGDVTTDNHPGVYVGGATGVDFMLWNSIGITTRLTGSYAPSLPNLIGDRHDTGLFGLDVGVVVRR